MSRVANIAEIEQESEEGDEVMQEADVSGRRQRVSVDQYVEECTGEPRHKQGVRCKLRQWPRK